MKEYRQIEWDAACEDDARQLVRLGVREDLDRAFDWTTVALVPPDAVGQAAVVTREPGVICGLKAAQFAIGEMNARVTWQMLVDDGAAVKAGQAVAEMVGDARDLLTAERLVLNLIGRLSGVATLTRRFADAVAGTKAKLYDTRKTTPGWRRLEKYAVRCGGGTNHRLGLFDGILIKDNHLAFGAQDGAGTKFTPAQAVLRARDFLANASREEPHLATLMVEVEVDSLAQLDEVLPTQPDIVLLDNMRPAELREAVSRRERAAPQVQLEASGGVNLGTIREIALTGVERISVGALTHSAINFDVGLDWK